MALFCDAAWRVVLVLAQALVPWAAPVDASPSGSTATAAVRCAALVLLYLAGLAGVRRLGGSYPGAAALAVSTLAMAPLVSAYCTGDRGPLARGVWMMAPLVWATLATVVTGPLLDAMGVGEGRGRWTAGAGVIAVGAVSLALGGGRLSPRETLWRNALALDPGNVSAALAVAAFDSAHHAASAAIDVLLACAKARPEACTCAEEAASEAIDHGRYLDARQALDASDTCPMLPHRRALTAEALIGTNARELGVAEAERAVAADPADAHAVYARAWATVLAGRPFEARADAAKAVSLGRGVPGELLYGMILYQAGELATADLQFERALAEDPDCVPAIFDRALVADRQLRYHDAREGYLRTLELDPKNADARYDLVILTHASGATREAQHHLDVFRASYPADPRTKELTELLAAPSPVKAMNLP
jgi:tetratricopeptide (TPR) repeat protein